MNMKIMQGGTSVEIDELKVGDVFMWGGNLCIKTEDFVPKKILTDVTTDALAELDIYEDTEYIIRLSDGKIIPKYSYDEPAILVETTTLYNYI